MALGVSMPRSQVNGFHELLRDPAFELLIDDHQDPHDDRCHHSVDCCASVATTQDRARFAFARRWDRFRERGLGAVLPLSASGAERVAAAIRLGDLDAFAGLRAGLLSSGVFAARLLCNAWTPSPTSATAVNFERNDIT